MNYNFIKNFLCTFNFVILLASPLVLLAGGCVPGCTTTCQVNGPVNTTGEMIPYGATPIDATVAPSGVAFLQDSNHLAVSYLPLVGVQTTTRVFIPDLLAANMISAGQSAVTERANTIASSPSCFIATGYTFGPNDEVIVFDYTPDLITPGNSTVTVNASTNAVTATINSLDFFCDGNTLAVGTPVNAGNNLFVFGIAGGVMTQIAATTFPSLITQLSVTPVLSDGFEYIVVGSSTSNIVDVYRLNRIMGTLTIAATANIGTSVRGLAFTHNGRFVAFAGADGTLYIYEFDPVGGTLTQTDSTAIAAGLNSVAFTSNDTIVGVSYTGLTGGLQLIGFDPTIGDLTVLLLTQDAPIATNGFLNIHFSPNCNFVGVRDLVAGTFRQAYVYQIPRSTVITSPTNGATVNTETPTIVGTATPGSTVEITADGNPTVIGTAVADASGNFSILITTALSLGSHTITATATITGFAPATSADTITINIAQADFLIITSPTNGSVINSNQTVITGITNPGNTVQLFLDGSLVPFATVTADAFGNFIALSPVLNNGAHIITASIEGTDVSAAVIFNVQAAVVPANADDLSLAIQFKYGLPRSSNGSFIGC